MDKLLTTTDLANRWQCSVDTVLKHNRKGLKVIIIGTKDYRYSLADILEYEENLKNPNRIEFEIAGNKQNAFKRIKCKNDFKLT